MTDLSKGLIEIDGFTVKPGTTLSEMQNFFKEKVRILDLSTGPRLKLQAPYYITDNIYAYGFNFNNDGVLTRFSLIPSIPDALKGRPVETAEYKLAESKKWLQKMIDSEPHTLNTSCVYYWFNSVDYFSSIRTDIHYGLLGGEIEITFHEV